MKTLRLLSVLVLASCKPTKDKPAPDPVQAAPTSPAPTQKASPKEEKPATPARAIQWIADDYPTAKRLADKSNKPLVIDLWAPWCHTCLSMKSTVLKDPGLLPHIDDFVWLALDTDKAENQAAVELYPPGPWPKFYVVSADREKVQAAHEGAATVKQMRALLASGREQHLASGTTGEASFVASGDRARAGKRYADAAAAYRRALETTPDNATIALKYASSLYKAEKWNECINQAETILGAAVTGHTASASDTAYYLSECAKRVAAEKKPAATSSLRAAQKALQTVLNDSAAPLSVDDRSDGLRILRELHLALDDTQRARAAAERQFQVLLAALGEDTPSWVAMTYNWPLAEVAHYLGRERDVIPMLQRSVTQNPTQYDPFYRLGWLYHKLGDKVRAKEYVGRALELSYGPRKTKIEELLKSIDAT